MDFDPSILVRDTEETAAIPFRKRGLSSAYFFDYKVGFRLMPTTAARDAEKL